MPSYFDILSAVAPVFLIVALGFGIRRVRWLTLEADASLLKAVVYVCYPALILETTLGNPGLADWRNLVVPPLAGFLTIVAGYAAAWYTAPLLGLGHGPVRRTFTLVVGIYNYGYLAIPVCESLFHSRATTGVLFIFNLGVEVAFWGVGVLILTGGSDRQAWRRIFNPPVLAILLGVAITLVGWADYVPAFVRTFLRMLGACAIPLGLILSGASIRDLTRDQPWVPEVRSALGGIALRLGALPLVFLAAAAWLPLSIELKRVLIVQAAMPAGIFPIVMARVYGGDTGTAIRVVVATSALGLFLIPLWIGFGLRWVL